MTIDVDNLEGGYKYKLKTMFRGADYNGKIENFCNSPRRDIYVDLNENCFLCRCDAWLPIPVGKVTDFNSIDEVFDSAIAKELQQDIEIDKKFTYCAVKHCEILTRNQGHDYTRLTISIDESCNLACPSCRREQYMISDGDKYDAKSKALSRIMSWLEKYDKPIDITTSGNGDCLASPIMRPLLKTYKPKDNQYFTLFTNGLLIEKTMANAPMLKQIVKFRISVDAGSADVYKVVRQPGKWETLVANLDWLDQQGFADKVVLAFVVQQKNYRDLINFVDFCQSRGYVGEITQLDDWATWESPANIKPEGYVDTFSIINGTYFENNVLNPAHVEHQECLAILKTIKDRNIERFIIAPPLLQLL